MRSRDQASGGGEGGELEVLLDDELAEDGAFLGDELHAQIGDFVRGAGQPSETPAPARPP
jgi:hypothetical protein